MDKFNPDWRIPPGETIAEELSERSISTPKFAVLLGQTTEYVEDLLCGRSVITEEIAQKLSEIFGTSKTLWVNLERNYRKEH